MARFKRILGNWYAVTLIAALIAILILCLGLPLFVLSMRPWSVRLGLAILVAGVWGGAWWWRRHRAARAASQLARALTGEQEGDVAAERLRGALDQMRVGSKRRDYLYARPWYVIIGPPGAGKTTALCASGLRFPAVDQAMKGAGGTRNLDFWFADEAVLVDTAGRYTTQDSSAAEDAAGWRGFLDALRKGRPIRPVNGVLVAIGLDEIAAADRATLDDHASAIRRRLTELTDTLDIDVPVYCLFTKSDLVAGFTDYFADLDVEGRRAVLGRTFEPGASPDADRLADAFDEVVQAVADRQPKRLSNEADVLRRGLILGYPAQLSSLRARMIRFLEGAFPAGKADAAGSAMLRGFYLTSGTQAGTPLDRLLAGVAEVYDRPLEAETGGGGGRAYFLNRLLAEVVFPEAGMARLRAAARRRQKLRGTGAVAAVAGAALLVALLWTVSFVRNRSGQQALAVAAREAEADIRQRGIDLVEVGANDAGLEEAAAVLDRLRALPGGYRDRATGYPPLTMRFGLWQSGLSDEAVQTYQQALRRILLPLILLRTEQALAGAGSDPMAAYEPLKAYLMLGGQRPGGVDARALKSFVMSDWERASLAGGDRADLRRRLALHLAALLDAGDLQRVWEGRRAPLDDGLVTSARAAVQSMPAGDRAYAMIRYGGAATSGPDWRADAILAPADAAAFGDPARVRGLSVPYFFTRGGYTRAYRASLLAIADQMRRDMWVLGDAGSGEAALRLETIRPQVAGRYATDYAAAWDGVLAALQPGPLFTDQAAFGAFTRLPSPFVRLLREVRTNTSLGGASDPVARAGAVLANRINSAAPSVSQLGSLAAAGLGSGDAGAMIQAHFAELSAYVGDGKQPAPLDAFIDAVRTSGQAVMAARFGGNASAPALQASLAQANAALAGAAAQAPAAIQGFAAALAEGGTGAQASVAQGNLQQVYASSVLPACRNATQGRYPFFGAATGDASVSETMQLLGPGGSLTGFIETSLRPLLDTGGPVWRWRGEDATAASFAPGSAEELAKAVAIRDLLVSGLPFRVQLVSSGPGVDAVEVSSGSTYRLDAGSREARQFQWTLQGGLPEAHVTLLKGGQKVDQIETSGPWAIFRLFDKARRQNDGQTSFLATFGAGDRTATLRVILADDRNPFGHGGIWTFRCPSSL